MDWLQSLVDSSSTPALTAFLLGLLTAISPCPLATNIAAIGFIGKNIESRRSVFLKGVLYAIATALPVLVVAWLLVFSIERVSEFYGKMQTAQKWLNVIVAVIFLATGVYYCIINFL